jgi:hypothetical protein
MVCRILSKRTEESMLIVEGPDGSGKTTLVKQLSEELDWSIAARVVDKDTTISGDNLTLMNWVDRNIEAGFQCRIFDRHRLISEPIYGPIFRGGLQDGFNHRHWFSTRWSQLMSTLPVIVFCLPRLSVVMENLKDDEDNLMVRDKTPLVYWQYWALACRIPCIFHDYTNSDSLITPQYIAHVATRRARDTA